MTTSHIIEPDREKSWVLRRFGKYETVASGPTAEDVRDQAFDRLRDHAPCSFTIMDEERETWQLEQGGEWHTSVGIGGFMTSSERCGE